MPSVRTHPVVLAVLIAAVLGIGGVTVNNALQAQQAQQAPATAIAVVDLQRTFEGLAQQQQIRADLQTRQEQLRQEQEQRRKQINTLQADLDLLAEGSQAHQQKEAERDQAVIGLQVWQEFEARRLRLEEQLQIENLFRKTNEVIQQVAQDNGYDLVLFKNQTVNLGQGANNQQAQLNIRIVAWSSDAVDLTDQVIQRMNNQFQAGQ